MCSLLKIFTRGSVNSQLAPTISSSRTRQVKTPHITGDAENQHVENDGDHTGKNLSDKSRYTEFAAINQASDRQMRSVKTDLVMLPEKMRAADKHRNIRAESGGKGGACKSQMKGEHKHIVKNDIKHTSRNRAKHRSGSSVVISGKCGKRIIADKKLRKDTYQNEGDTA